MEDFFLSEKLLRFCDECENTKITEEQLNELREEYSSLEKIHIDEIPSIFNIEPDYEEVALC